MAGTLGNKQELFTYIGNYIGWLGLDSPFFQKNEVTVGLLCRGDVVLIVWENLELGRTF